MPLYSLKISTYDPEIIDAFDRLRKSRKQATFTHEAIKYFLESEKGLQMMELMAGESIQSKILTLDSNFAEISKGCVITEQTVTSTQSADMPRDYLSDVMNNLFK